MMDSNFILPPHLMAQAIPTNTPAPQHAACTCMQSACEGVETKEFSSPADMKAVSCHISLSSQDSLTGASEGHRVVVFFQNVLKNMRTETASLHGSQPIAKLHEFVTDIYHSQLRAVSAAASENLTQKGILDPSNGAWALIGAGSLGRGEVCPYSDLDFAIVVESKTEDLSSYLLEYTTEIHTILEKVGDKGMVFCSGNVVPPYRHEIGHKGDKNLVGTIEEMVQNRFDALLTPGKAVGHAEMSLFETAWIHGKEQLCQGFHDTIKRVLNEKPHGGDATYGQLLGARVLAAGADFRGDVYMVEDFTKATNSFDITIIPFCSVKKACLRPIQNAVLGLCLSNGIFEPNTSKGIVRLIDSGVFTKEYGNSLKAYYEGISDIRLKLEIEHNQEVTNVTVTPTNIRAKNAKEISPADAQFITSGATILRELDTFIK